MRRIAALSLASLSLLFLLGLSPGERAPEFSARNQDGKTVRLSDFKGKPVLLYFYPKDDTPGCTKEACSFRDGFAAYRKQGVVILGVSRQDEESHRAFRAKYHLPFDLLADTDGQLAKAYGVGSILGTGYLKRESVLIGPDGKVIRYYHDVNPATHSQEVLQDLRTQVGESKSNPG